MKVCPKATAAAPLPTTRMIAGSATTASGATETTRASAALPYASALTRSNGVSTLPTRGSECGTLVAVTPAGSAARS